MDEQVVRFRELSVAVFADELFLGSRSGDARCSHRGRVSAWHSLRHRWVSQ